LFGLHLAQGLNPNTKPLFFLGSLPGFCFGFAADGL